MTASETAHDRPVSSPGALGRNPVMDLSGWEAFVHGVFAISATLLVLDIHVPDAAEIDTASALIQALIDLAPRYAAYVLGFLAIGTYWINMHRGLRLLRGLDHQAIVIGMVFLMFIAAVPFVTALLAEYIGADDGRERVALVVFTLWQFVLSLLAFFVLGYGYRKRRLLLRADVSEAGVRSWLQLAALGPVIWMIALGSAVLASGTVTLILIAVVYVMFLFEPRMRQQPQEAAS